MAKGLAALAGVVAAVFAAWALAERRGTVFGIVETVKALSSLDVTTTIFGLISAATMLAYCSAGALVGYITYRVCLLVFKG